jgi:cystathionine beta-lyase
MQFDNILPMRDVFNGKHVRIASHIGIDAPDTIPMQVADSDYASPPCVVEALRKVVDVGAFCYGYDKAGYLEALRWWLEARHGWMIEPDWVVTSQGLGHAIATCIDIWTEPGEGVCYFAPVYHEFRLKTERAGRTPVELPLALVDGRYELDWEAAEAAITPDTRLLLFCSPQNPSGRVWTPDELRAVADFAARHDLILVSDEVHCDLIYDGVRHVPMDIAAPEHRNRTVTLFAGSKTFNLAGLRIGQMILPDPDLRARVQSRMTAWNYDPATLGIVANKAAYSPAGAEWLEAQMAHLARNRQLFDDGINAIPGVTSMRLESTFLPWVDFSDTGMDAAEITRRVHREARIGTAPGPWFGAGGETFQRFNIAMPRSVIEETVARMQKAFGDLQ